MLSRKFFTKTILQFVKFCIVGVSNTLISYVIYSILVLINIYYILASIIAFIVGITNSFYWNDKFVFATNKNKFFVYLKTVLSYSFTGIIVHNIFLILLIEKFSINKYIAPLFILIITIPLNFILNKFWAFNEKVEYEKN